MLIAILLAHAAVQTPPLVAASVPSAWSTYVGCIREQSARWSGTPDAPSHLGSVVAACEPGVAPAAAVFADSVRASAVFPTMAAAYRERHGSELVIDRGIEQLVRDAGRDGAMRLLAGRPFPQATLSIAFDADGVVLPRN